MAASMPMSFAVDPEWLEYQRAIRGLSASDLARVARISAATMSAGGAGKRLAEASWRQIAKALKATPVDPIIEALLPKPGKAPGDEDPTDSVGGDD